MTGEQPGTYTQLVGARLREIRLARQMSLFEVECASDRRIKASILGSYERAERVINVDRLAALAEFYEVPISDLLPSPDGATAGSPPEL